MSLGFAVHVKCRVALHVFCNFVTSFWAGTRRRVRRWRWSRSDLAYRGVAANTQLELNVRLQWLAQETSDKNVGCVLLRRLLRQPQQMSAQFKLSVCSLSRDKQDPIETSAFVGPAGAYQARKPSQNGLHSVVFVDAVDVQRGPQKLTRTTTFRSSHSSTNIFGKKCNQKKATRYFILWSVLNKKLPAT